MGRESQQTSKGTFPANLTLVLLKKMQNINFNRDIPADAFPS
jgi:hypothetical protein